MTAVLERAGAFIVIILIGFTLKKKGLFKKEDFYTLSKIVLKITLPCAIISNFGTMKLENSLLILIAFGVGMNVILILLGVLQNRGSKKAGRPFDMVNLAGYNIGAFGLPFAQSFLGPMGVVAASLFDTGNSIMCTGLTYTVAQMVKDSQEGRGRFSIKKVAKDLFSSAPFDTYLIMIIIAVLQIPLPHFVFQVASVGANANAFIAMLMIGIGADLFIDKEKLQHMIRLLGVREGVSILLALAMYNLPVFALEVRQALAIMCLTPISSVSPAFTGKLDGDIELASSINSISIVISVFTMTTALILMLG